MKHRHHEIPPERAPIEVFALKYEIPIELAKTLIGRTEAETMHNMGLFLRYVYHVVKRHRKRMRAQ